MHRLLLNREIYEEVIQVRLPQARQFIWIVTADIKDMYVEAWGGFVPLLELLADKVSQGVAVRLIHAKEPGPRFRADFDRFDELVDNDRAFVGSPNLTGAGLGSKHEDKRNFEAGFLFDEQADIQKLVRWVDELYLGEYCQSCRRREYCPDPIDSI